MTGQALLDLMTEIGSMKTIHRTGWGIYGIKSAESIADHCYRVSMFAMLLADVLNQHGEDIDVEKVMRMALLHEMAEARIGDIPLPATRYFPEGVKAEAEEKAITEMLEGFGSLKDYYIGLWREYEFHESLEGHLVQIADKMELMIQVSQYEALGYENLIEFWDTAEWIQRGFYDYPLTADIMGILVNHHNMKVRGKTDERNTKEADESNA